WAAALRALGAGAREGTAGESRARLLRIAEDPAAEAVERVAAAVALGGDLDEESRARLRAAAAARAAPRLRGGRREAAGSGSGACGGAVFGGAAARAGQARPRASRTRPRREAAQQADGSDGCPRYARASAAHRPIVGRAGAPDGRSAHRSCNLRVRAGSLSS